MPSIKPAQAPRQHTAWSRPRAAAAKPGGERLSPRPHNGAAAAATESADTALLRDQLRTAIAALNEEQHRLDGLTEGRTRAHNERRQAQAALDDAHHKLEHLRAEAKADLAYDYLNREKSKLPIAETEALINRHRNELERLIEIDQALTSEIARTEERLRRLNIARQQVLADVLIADPAFRALVDAVPAAWAHLRTMRGALAAVHKTLGTAFPDRFRSTYQCVESLDLDVSVSATPEGGLVPVLVPIAADRALIETSRAAVARLRDDASAELPELNR